MFGIPDWVTLEEYVLRERVTTDIATKGGQFDVLTIGTYEVPWPEILHSAVEVVG